MAADNDISAWIDELGSALQGMFPAEDKELSPSAGTGRAMSSADKLAYLAYTGKVEHFVRDELAWALQQARDKGPYGPGAIKREHKRIDLVALDPADELQYLLQAKAMYVGDFIPSQSWNPLPHQLLNDLADDVCIKAKGTFNRPSAGLLLITDIPHPPSGRTAQLAYEGIVRRQAGRTDIEGSLSKELPRLLSAAVDASGQQAPLTMTGKTGCWRGNFKGEVCVHWYLVI